jgi:hypothetical protein
MVAASVRRSVVAGNSISSPRRQLLANEPGFVAWEMLRTLSHIRCGGPSAVRTRRAANRALSRPFVPLRQLTVFYLALASICSAAIDKISGTWCFRGLPRALVIGQMSFTSNGYTSGAEGYRPPRPARALLALFETAR